MTIPVTPSFKGAPKPHVFGEAVRVDFEEPGPIAWQKEKTCKVCGVVRITAFNRCGDPRREWRLAGDTIQVGAEFAPGRVGIGGRPT